jgi:hypothetical protein
MSRPSPAGCSCSSPRGGAVAPLGAGGYADGIDWALVRYGGTTGWVASAFLGGVSAGGGGEPAAAAPVAAAPPGVAGLVVGGNAQVVGTDGYDLRVRDGIGAGAPIFTTVPGEHGRGGGERPAVRRDRRDLVWDRLRRPLRLGLRPISEPDECASQPPRPGRRGDDECLRVWPGGVESGARPGDRGGGAAISRHAVCLGRHHAGGWTARG